MRRKKLQDSKYVTFLKTVDVETWKDLIPQLPIYDGIDSATRALHSVDDKAMLIDRYGFSPYDIDVGWRVATNGIRHAGPLHAHDWALRLLKYRTQLKELGICYPDIMFEGNTLF